jgi:hypothetical protein
VSLFVVNAARGTNMSMIFGTNCLTVCQTKKHRRRTKQMYHAEKEVIIDVVTHYRRMLEYAKAYRGDRNDLRRFMLEAIDESWGGTYCALCKIYGDLRCDGCPGKEMFDREALDQAPPCTNGLWGLMQLSGTVEGWIKYAEKILKVYLRMLS